MARMTDIEWADATWNPLRGCTRISSGCMNCYAERMAARGLPGLKSPTTGEPFAVMSKAGPAWTGRVELVESKLTEPLGWRKPLRIFVNSMSDTFHESVTFDEIHEIVRVAKHAHQHTYLILTKRARRMHEFVRWWISIHERWPRNVWLGISAEDQPRLEERITFLHFLTPARRFLSLEPLLGEIDLSWHLKYCEGNVGWVIVGGESGPGARTCDARWIEGIIEQCRSAGVPCFVKQMGSHPLLCDAKGGNPDEWLLPLRVRESPFVGSGPEGGFNARCE